jgi:DNA-binding IclR family transcriptional regulator
MMAALSDAQLNRLRKRITYAKLTKYTLRTWDELNREIQEARKQGVAFDREETTIGISCVGAALRLPGGTLAAVAIPTPTSRFNSSEKALTKTLLEHCEALQAAIDRMYIDSEPNPQTR